MILKNMIAMVSCANSKREIKVIHVGLSKLAQGDEDTTAGLLDIGAQPVVII